jgi:type I restriction enzyme S subunit
LDTSFRPISEILASIIDHRGLTATKIGGKWENNEGIPVISANNIKNGIFVEMDSVKRINKDLFEKWMPVKLRQGDVLLVSEGATFGELLYLTENLKASLGQRLFALRCNSEYDGKYLYYYLRSEKGQQELSARTTGTSVLGIRQSELILILVPNIKIEEQEVIGNILGAIDDKIKLNQEMNKTLEAIGEAVFKRWFVDFEFPNQEGKPYKTTGGQMVYNETLGIEIPEGWRVNTLDEISFNFDSKRVPLSSREREKRRGNYPYYGAAGILDYVDDFTFEGTYALMGEDGTVIDDLGFPVLQLIRGRFWVNNHAHVLQGKGISTELLFLFLKNTSVQHLVTGAVQPKINQGNMNSLKFVIPDSSCKNRLESFVNSLYLKIGGNKEQIKVLSQIRDLLLPKLISGKIRVPISKEKVEAFGYA